MEEINGFLEGAASLVSARNLLRGSGVWAGIMGPRRRPVWGKASMERAMRVKISVIVVTFLSHGLLGCLKASMIRRRSQEPQVAECQAGKETYGPRSLRLLTNSEYQRTVRDLFGIQTNVTQDFPPEIRQRGERLVTEDTVITEAHASAYLKAASVIAEQVSKNTGSLWSCQTDEADEACVRRFFSVFGKKVYRGPLDTAEIDRLLSVYRVGKGIEGGFTGGLKWSLQAMLISPRFLYRFELGDPVGDAFHLNSWELAQALSYTYLGTTPDDRLLALAAEGTLIRREVLLKEAARLMALPESRAIFGEFVARWLEAEDVLSVNKDAQLFPEFTSNFRLQLLEETREFFTQRVLDQKSTFESLFLSQETTGGDDLSRFYGGRMEGRLIRLPPGERSGLLTQGSVIAAHSHADESSPIKRGLFVLQQVFCIEIPSPPPSLNVMPPPRDPNASTRDRFARHSSSPACSGCHVLIDGIGFGMEDMDAIGRFRRQEGARPVDASGLLVGIDEGGERSFKGTAALSQFAGKSPKAAACFAKKAQRYLTGRRERAEDRCADTDLYQQFAAQGFNLYQFFANLMIQPSFLKRKP